MASLFIQHIDGSVESIPVLPGPQPNQVLLTRAPKLALSLDPNHYARATFTFVRDQEVTAKPFLLTERNPKRSTNDIKAVNYDPRYYQMEPGSAGQDEWPWGVGGPTLPDRVMVLGTEGEVFFSEDSGDTFAQRNVGYSGSANSFGLSTATFEKPNSYVLMTNTKYVVRVSIEGLTNVRISQIKFQTSNTTNQPLYHRGIVYAARNTDAQPSTLLGTSGEYTEMVPGWNTINFDPPIVVPDQDPALYYPYGRSIWIGLICYTNLGFGVYIRATATSRAKSSVDSISDTYSDGPANPFVNTNLTSNQYKTDNLAIYANGSADIYDMPPTNQYSALISWNGERAWSIDLKGNGIEHIYRTLDDGTTWVKSLDILPSGVGLLSLEADPNRGYVAAYTYNGSPRQLWVSNDRGVTFTAKNPPPPAALSYELAIKYVNGILIHFGNDYTTNLGVGSYSLDDGTTWQAVTSLLPQSGTIMDVAGNGSTIVSVGGRYIYVKDSITGSPTLAYQDTDTGVGFDTVSWDGSQYVAISGSSYTPRMMISPDGHTWFEVTMDPTINRSQGVINGDSLPGGKIVFGDDDWASIWVGPPWMKKTLTLPNRLFAGVLATSRRT